MRILVLSFISCIAIAVLLTSFTNSLFSTKAQITTNSITMAEVFDDLQNPPGVNHIVINEVSPTGTAAAEWVELYNPTEAAINVGGWIIADASGQDDNLPSAEIPAKSYAVVVSNASVVNIPAGVVKISVSLNGIGGGLNELGDVVEIKNGDTVIDAMNYGNNSSYFSNGPAAPTAGTISRIPNGKDTDNGTDWETNTNPTIGASNQ